MNLQKIDTFEKLLEYLRTWTVFTEDNHVYDFNGVLFMMLACMDNIKDHCIPEDLVDIGECFTKEQREFFILVADVLKNKSWDND
jgi:hypothetical protein